MMPKAKAQAILSSAYNAHIFNTTKTGGAMTPSTIEKFNLSHHDKEFLLKKYMEYSLNDKRRLHSDDEIIFVIGCVWSGSI